MSYLKSLPKDTANITVTQYGSKRVQSDEHLAKLSKARKGKTISQAQRDLISKRHTGKTVSAETRAKISAAQKGRTYTAKKFQGKTIQEWADFYGIRYDSMWDRIHRNGTPHPQPSRAKLYRGRKASEWAEQYGVSVHTIRNHLKAHGNLAQLRKSLKSK